MKTVATHGWTKRANERMEDGNCDVIKLVLSDLFNDLIRLSALTFLTINVIHYVINGIMIYAVSAISVTQTQHTKISAGFGNESLQYTEIKELFSDCAKQDCQKLPSHRSHKVVFNKSPHRETKDNTTV